MARKGIKPQQESHTQSAPKTVPRKLLIVDDLFKSQWVIQMEWKGTQTRSYQVPPEVGARAMERAQDAVMEVIAAWALSTGRISAVNLKPEGRQ